MTDEQLRLTAMALRRDARDYRDGLYALGTDATMETAADAIDRLTADNAALREWQEKAREALWELVEEYDSPGDLDDLMYWIRNNLHRMRDLIGGRDGD